MSIFCHFQKNIHSLDFVKPKFTPKRVKHEFSSEQLNSTSNHLESNCLVRFRCKQQVLPLPVWWLHLLFIGSHETMSRDYAIDNLWVVNLEQVKFTLCTNPPLAAIISGCLVVVPILGSGMSLLVLFY